MRRLSLAFAVLLIGIFLANVAGADETNLLLQVTSPTANMTKATVDCEANVLSWETREASPTATTSGICGCGGTACLGVESGAPCFGEVEESACVAIRACTSNPPYAACVCYVFPW